MTSSEEKTKEEQKIRLDAVSQANIFLSHIRLQGQVIDEDMFFSLVKKIADYILTGELEVKDLFEP